MSNTDNYGWSSNTCANCKHKNEHSKTDRCVECMKTARKDDRFPMHEEE